MALDKVDSIIQNAIETTDSRVARQQGILFAGLKGTINDVRLAYRSELDHTVDSLSRIEQQVFRDLDASVVQVLNVVETLDLALEERTRQMQAAMNQVLDRLPLTKKDPVLLTVLPVFGQDPAAADMIIYGYRLGNDLDEQLRPEVKINDIPLAPEWLTVDYDRVSVRIPADTESQLRALFSPCAPVKEIIIDGTFRYKSAGFFGLGRSVKEVHLRRLVPLPETFHAAALVQFRPQQTTGVSAAIPFSFDSPQSFSTKNPGAAWYDETVVGTLLYIAPDDATNLTITEWGWHRINNMDGTRRSTDAPVLTGRQISLKGELEATTDWGGRRWGHLFVNGSFTRPQVQTRNFAPRTEKDLPFVSGQAQLTVASLEDAAALPGRIVVTLFRAGCSDEADRIEFVTAADGSGEANSRTGNFAAKLLGGSLTIRRIN